MTVGDEPDYFDALAEFSSIMEEKSEGTVDFSYVKMKSENHATIPYITLFNGLRFVFSEVGNGQKGMGKRHQPSPA